MKNKLSKNIIIDTVLLVDLSLLSVSSYILKVLLPGGGPHFGGGNGMGASARQFMGISRHTWGDIHLYVGIFFIAILVAHICMHWGMLNAFMKKQFPSALTRNLLYLFMLVLLLVTILPWIFYFF